MSEISKACCTIPPVVIEGYVPKGEYRTIKGLKTYIASPKGNCKGIVLAIYDIFGFFSQTLQGADIVASNGYKVYMPDFFEGNPVDISCFPPKNDEQKTKLGAFFQNQGNLAEAVARISEIVDKIKKGRKNGDKDLNFAIYGLCWGGKIAALVSQEGSLFKCAVSAHPAMVEPKDAPGITIPFAMLPSKDEETEAVDQFMARLKDPKHVEKFPKQKHGFMGARSNLEDEEERKGYERGYKILCDFFQKHL